MLTKIGIIGDIHAEINHLTIALEFLQQKDVQSILCTGDIADTPGEMDSCCELLIKHNVQTVLGNHDECFIMNQLLNITPETIFTKRTPNREYVYQLPVTRDIHTLQGELLLCHGIGKHTMRKVREDDFGYALESNFELHEITFSKKYRFMVNGHSHWRMVRTIDGLTIINAGTLFMPHNPCFGIIDFNEFNVSFYEIGNNSEAQIVEKETISLNQASYNTNQAWL